MEKYQNLTIIGLNGPARCGKDTVGENMRGVLLKQGHRVRIVKCASILKRAVHELFGYEGVGMAYFEDLKETPMDEFFGLTPRQAYIWLSEECVKPKFGNAFFGRILAFKIKQLVDQHVGMNRPEPFTIIITDTGFTDEWAEIVKIFGDSAKLTHVRRKGCDFKKSKRTLWQKLTGKINPGDDSREYINAFPHSVFDNDGSLVRLHDDVFQLLWVLGVATVNGVPFEHRGKLVGLHPDFGGTPTRFG